MIENGDVMRGRSQSTLTSRWMRPKIDAHGIEVVEIAQIAAPDDFLHFAHRTSIDKGVVDHEGEAALGAMSIRLSASATEAAIGFSTRTCLPCSRALRANS